MTLKEISYYCLKKLTSKFIETTLTIKVDVAEDNIGYVPKPIGIFDYEHKDYGLIESVFIGVSEGVSTLAIMLNH